MLEHNCLPTAIKEKIQKERRSSSTSGQLKKIKLNGSEEWRDEILEKHGCGWFCSKCGHENQEECQCEKCQAEW